MNDSNASLTRIRLLLTFFMLGLIISGLTAIPLQWELRILDQIASSLDESFGSIFSGLNYWVAQVNEGVQATFSQYPFMAIGTDWLAFGHIAIGAAFIGPLKDPKKNIWVIEFGMIICVMLIPWALFFGYLRDLPFYWRLIECSFGVFGIIPLWIARNMTLKMTALNEQSPTAA